MSKAQKIEARKITDAYEETGVLLWKSRFRRRRYPPFLEPGTLGIEQRRRRKDAFELYRGTYVEYCEKTILRSSPTSRWTRARAVLQQYERVLEHSTCDVPRFGPRFLHSTDGYKGGANMGYFCKKTSDDQVDVPVPGQNLLSAWSRTAQARGDFQVLLDRADAPCVSIWADVESGLGTILKAVH